MADLDGRVAVVMGSARGIGLEIAERLSAAGASVVVADIDGATGKKRKDFDWSCDRRRT